MKTEVKQGENIDKMRLFPFKNTQYTPRQGCIYIFLGQNLYYFASTNTPPTLQERKTPTKSAHNAQQANHPPTHRFQQKEEKNMLV